MLALAFLFSAGGGHAAESLLNHPAPDFARTTLGGTPIRLADFRGKVVLLNFWATWCAPCRVEIPRFTEWQRQFGPQGFQVLAVSMDDDPSPVRTFVQRTHPNFPIVMGDARLGELYGGVLGVPVTFLIDRSGIVRRRYDGGPVGQDVAGQIHRLLDATPTRPHIAVALSRPPLP